MITPLKRNGGEPPRRMVGPGSFDQPQQMTKSLPITVILNYTTEKVNIFLPDIF